MICIEKGNKTIKAVFILLHSYELYGYERAKIIGTYSSKEQAESAIARLKDKNGFKHYPDAFEISGYDLTKTTGSRVLQP